MAQKELGYVELEWTCPACNTRNAGSARKCTQCGASQPEAVKFEQAPDEKLITDEAKLKEAAVRSRCLLRLLRHAQRQHGQGV